MMTEKQPVNIFWFRRDLRFEDNCGLYHALSSGLPVLPVFIFDKNILDPLPRHDSRITFIHQTLEEMNRQLNKLKCGLDIRYGRPVEIFKSLVRAYDIKLVYVNHDYEPYALQRDSEIKILLQEHGIDFRTYKDQVIFEKNEIINQSGKPYTVFTPYRKAWQENLHAGDLAPYPSQALLDHLLQQNPERIPTLQDMGFEKTAVEIPPTDVSEDILRLYDRQRDFPGIDGTSKISVHLRFGTVSIRRQVEKGLSLNETWLSELIWREFFMMILANFPHVVERPFNANYESIPWKNNEKDFRRWCDGTTGYPIVDAGMRELNTTGYMHNRVRMITASFLTKHLLIDWRKGERYFALKLMDYDLAANNGNWQWAAGCGCDAAPYFRVFNPYIQTKKFDPEYQYIRRWVPEFDTPDYPEPMIEHSIARKRALAVYREALKKDEKSES